MEKDEVKGTDRKPSLFQRLKTTAQRFQVEAYAFYLACKDKRTPWYAKVWTLFIVAHTFSPIDLIPDFIPVLGYLDDIIITPIGFWLALKMIPAEVMEEAREKANQTHGFNNRLGRVGAGVVILIWVAVAVWISWLIIRFVRDRR